MKRNDANISFFTLDPLNEHCCRHCKNSYIELQGFLGKHFCKVFVDVGMNENYNYIRPNDCKKWILT